MSPVISLGDNEKKSLQSVFTTSEIPFSSTHVSNRRTDPGSLSDANMDGVKIQLDRIWIEKQGANIRLRIAFNNFSLGTTDVDCKIAVYY